MHLAAAILSIAALASVPEAIASDFTYTRIANASDHPDWGQDVYFGPPAIDAGQVVFNVFNPSPPYRTGVYVGDGGPIVTIADDTMTIPGSSNTFDSRFSDPAISGENVAFLTYDGSYPVVVASFGGVLTQIAPFESPDPDGTGTLGIDFNGNVSIEGEDVAFAAFTDGGTPGVYTNVAGTIVPTADDTTHVPGGEPLYIDVIHPMLDGGRVAVRGENGSERGIYVADQSIARVVADVTTLIPGTGEPFTYFENRTSADSGNIVFRGGGVTIGGIFAEIDGALVLVSTDYLVDHPSIRGDRVAFHGAGDGWRDGIYVFAGGSVQTVIEIGDPLDGKIVYSLALGPGGLGNGELAFTATFTDSTSGVYYTALPEPGMIATLLAGVLAIRILDCFRARTAMRG